MGVWEKKHIYGSIIAVRKDGKVGLLDGSYNQVTKFIYDDIIGDTNADRILAIKDGKYGYLNTAGKEMIPFTFSKAYGFNAYGYAHVEDDFGKTKLIDKYGKVVYESKDRVLWFAEAYDIDTHYVILEDNQKIGWFKNYIYDSNLYVHRISDWAREHVLKAIDEGYVQETIQSNYTHQITRLEAVQLMIKVYEKIMNVEGVYEGHPFTDTNDISVAKAYTLGFITGASERAFGPDKYVTREQLCVMLDNFYKALNRIPPNDLRTFSFVDEGDISSWAVDSVNLLYGLGIVNGMEDGKILPKKYATREEMIVMIYDLIK